jgi:hypothetical protein
MKKIVLFLIASALGFAIPLSGVLWAAPKMVLSSLLVDAGENPAGTTATHAFTVKNEGSDPLIIEKVIPSCGCTLASYDDFIPPGREGKILVNVDLYKEWAGRKYNKSVTVVTNDPNQSHVTLRAAGKVGEPLPASNASKKKSDSPKAPGAVKASPVPESFNLVVRRGDD